MSKRSTVLSVSHVAPASRVARASTKRRRASRREDGAVMLVVMLILLVATSLATIALQTTQHELRSAGYNRGAVQTQYIAESTMVTTLTYLDGLAQQNQLSSPFFCPPGGVLPTAPRMDYYGEPSIVSGTADRHFATRTEWLNQRTFFTPYTLAPLTSPGFTNPGNSVTDLLGTLGPQTARRPGAPPPTGGATALADSSEDYAVDVYDCQTLSGGATAGQVAAGAGTNNGAPMGQYYCVVTSRGRSYITGTYDLSTLKNWTVNNQTYGASRFTFAHDARSTIITSATPLGCPG